MLGLEGVMKSLLRRFLLAFLLLGGPLARASLLSSISYVSCAAPCTNPSFVATTATDTSVLSYADAYGAIFAQADYGLLKASVDSSYASTIAGSSFSTGSSLAQFSDSITLGGLSGPQEVTVVLHFEGSLGSVGEQALGTSASMTISLSVGDNSIALVADYFGNLPLLQAGAGGPGLSATYMLEYGVPISLAGLLQVTGALGGYAHFGNTATLEFIVPEGTTIATGSGSEYLVSTLAVPEPASTALFLLGLAALGAAHHRYRRS
jgi:hypothetical protein